MNKDLFSNRTIIPNANQYSYEKKYISVHSEDRDVTKNANSSEFEISLPQEYLNVVSARLSSWSFPSNYDVFNITSHNVNMAFKFKTIFDPQTSTENDTINDTLLQAIYTELNSIIDFEYIITIEPGFYNPDQMATELTNKFNEAVTIKLVESFANSQPSFTEYTRFKIVYNNVQQKLWFGNGADQFVLSNDSNSYVNCELTEKLCARKRKLPEFVNWGLPSYLGFTREPVISNNVQDIIDSSLQEPSVSTISLAPRFYYGDTNSGLGLGVRDNGFWLSPSATGATVQFLQAPLKISIMGQSYIYMEIDGMNCIDETSPWNLTEYSIHHNQTNGIVNSSFAKILVPTIPISQLVDNVMTPYKHWNPPAERINKLKVKFRYHNGKLVDFGALEYSFMIEFNLLRSQQERSYSIKNAFNLEQYQTL